MSTTSETSFVAQSEPELTPYKAICRSAIMSVVLALLSLPFVVVALISLRDKYSDSGGVGAWGAVIAIAAFLLGLAGLSTIRRYPAEYTGGRLAWCGLLAGLLLFVTGSTVAAYAYATEVPEGYTSVYFSDLQPDPDHPELPISPKAIELTGKKIFIKGYMHPGVASLGKVKHFILVNDFGTCCFGGQPKPTHMIEIYVPPEAQGVAYSTSRMKITGTFVLATQPTESLGLNGVWYHLQVDQVR